METTTIERKVEEFIQAVDLSRIDIEITPISYFTMELSFLNKKLSGFLNTETSITKDEVKALKEGEALIGKIYDIYKKHDKAALSEFDDECELYKEVVSDFINFRTNSAAFNRMQATLQSLSEK